MIPVRVNNNNDVSATGSRYSLYKAYIGLLLLETGHIKLLANDGIAPHDAGIDIPTTCAGALQFTYTSAAPAGYVTTPYTLSFDSCSIHNVDSLDAVLKIEVDGFTFSSNQGLLPRGGQYSPALKYWNVTPPPAAPHPVRFVRLDDDTHVGIEFSDGSIKNALDSNRYPIKYSTNPLDIDIYMEDCDDPPFFDDVGDGVSSDGVAVSLEWLSCSISDDMITGAVKVSVDDSFCLFEDEWSPGVNSLDFDSLRFETDE